MCGFYFSTVTLEQVLIHISIMFYPGRTKRAMQHGEIRKESLTRTQLNGRLVILQLPVNYNKKNTNPQQNNKATNIQETFEWDLIG